LHAGTMTTAEAYPDRKGHKAYKARKEPQDHKGLWDLLAPWDRKGGQGSTGRTASTARRGWRELRAQPAHKGRRARPGLREFRDRRDPRRTCQP
jgi:hypothetical protein